ncbi:MAG: hypothetical protein KGJ03_00920 [Betaproteobacteria bacterium]|nr:hypothetical protein [Betaproteobacteria bacterium]
MTLGGIGMMRCAVLGALGTALLAPATLAAMIVRCGNSYSDTPSAGCRQVAITTAARHASGAPMESQYAVDGVRTGMTLGQAEQAIAVHFGIPASEVLQRQRGSGALGATEVLSYISNRMKGPAIGVLLGMDPSSSSLRVEMVVVGQVSTVSGRQRMRADALARYGPPTGESAVAQSAFWCERAAKVRGACLPDAPRLMLFNSGYGVSLKSLTGGGVDMMVWDTLALNTTQFANARAREAQRHMKERPGGGDQGAIPSSMAHPMILPTLAPNASADEVRAYQHKLLVVSLDQSERILQADLRAFPDAARTGYGAQAIERDRQRIATIKRKLDTP